MGAISSRWRVWRTLREFEIPVPFSMDRLLATESLQHGKPIQVVRATMTGSLPTAMVMRTDVADYLVVAYSSSDAYQRHVIFHELYHRRARHPGCELQSLVDGAETREGREDEAELFARLAERKLVRLARKQPPKRTAGALASLRWALNPSAEASRCLA